MLTIIRRPAHIGDWDVAICCANAAAAAMFCSFSGFPTSDSLAALANNGVGATAPKPIRAAVQVSH